MKNSNLDMEVSKQRIFMLVRSLEEYTDSGGPDVYFFAEPTIPCKDIWWYSVSEGVMRYIFSGNACFEIQVNSRISHILKFEVPLVERALDYMVLGVK